MPQSDGPRLNGRNGRIWQAYLMGHTQQRIADDFSLGQQRVSEILAAVRESIPDTDRSDAALLDLERLDLLLGAHMPPALEGDVKAAGLVLRLLERRAKALGTDATEPLHVVLDRHRDLEGALVAEALVAGLDALELSVEQRTAALGAAQAALAGEDPPDGQQPVYGAPVAPSGPSAEDVRRGQMEADFRRFAVENGFDPDEDDDDGEEGGGDG
jgi:hypothetical protein